MVEFAQIYFIHTRVDVQQDTVEHNAKQVRIVDALNKLLYLKQVFRKKRKNMIQCIKSKEIPAS